LGKHPYPDAALANDLKLQDELSEYVPAAGSVISYT